MTITSIQHQKETYYKALVNRDSEYIGLFFAAIKTTGVFCICTCRARKPKFENVVFYKKAKSALQHGYRPCKICKPTNSTFNPPKYIQEALGMLFESDVSKVSDYDLREAGLSPEKIRRWFKANHGITFQAYQRMLRINTAFQDLKSGSKVAQAAYGSGYDSLSGFGYTFKVLTGKSPKKNVNKQVIQLTKTDTPLGPMFIAATENGLCMLEFSDRRMLETVFRDLQHRLNAVILHGENKITKQTKQELREYFKGNRITFTIPVDAPGTEFQQNVWEVLQSIPYAETRSYQEQANLLGKPKAVRAVANANGFNRISIVIPCHRVVGKDGSLTGYGGGLERKKWLLDFERTNISQ